MNSKRRREENDNLSRVVKLRTLGFTLLTVLLVAIVVLIRYYHNTVDIDDKDELIHMLKNMVVDLRESDTQLLQIKTLEDYCAVLAGKEDQPTWLYLFLFKRYPVFNRYSCFSWTSGPATEYYREDLSTECLTARYAVQTHLPIAEPLLVVYGKNPNNIYRSYTVENGDFTYIKKLSVETESFLDIYYSNTQDEQVDASFNQ